MINIYDQIYAALQPLGYPVREQGTYAATDTLPETFITYFVASQDDKSHADNLPQSQVSAVQVALYSKRPAIVQNADQALRAALIPAGFLRAGGRALPFEATTRHYGYVTTYNFYDSEG